MMRIGKVFGLVYICLLSSSAIVHSQPLKDSTVIFEEATHYTVKVRAVIDYPSIQDNYGVFFGAGFLIDEKRGWIATNAHVTGRNPGKLTVKFKNKKFIHAKPIYIDSFLDFAIIKIPPSAIPSNTVAAIIDCKKKARLGSRVGAFGHPKGLDFTGTRGIISGHKYRWSRDWVQTDAPINKGNSGGPLINLSNGKVIGVNTAGFSKKETEGLGFAIPPKDFCPIIERLKNQQNPNPPIIPVSLSLDHESDSGLNVMNVFTKLSVRWNLKEQDKILGRIIENGNLKGFATPAELLTDLRSVSMKEAIIIIKRAGKELRISVPIKRWKPVLERNYIYFSGLNVGQLELRDKEISNPNNYLIIHDVKDNSIGDVAGLRAWDRIKSVDGLTLKTIKDLHNHLIKRNNKKVSLNIIRSKTSYKSLFQNTLKEVEVKDARLTHIKQ